MTDNASASAHSTSGHAAGLYNQSSSTAYRNGKVWRHSRSCRIHTSRGRRPCHQSWTGQECRDGPSGARLALLGGLCPHLEGSFHFSDAIPHLERSARSGQSRPSTLLTCQVPKKISCVGRPVGEINESNQVATCRLDLTVRRLCMRGDRRRLAVCIIVNVTKWNCW